MNNRIYYGFAVTIFGFILIVLSFFGMLFLSIYGVLILIIGIFIVLNKKENEIEKIRYPKK